MRLWQHTSNTPTDQTDAQSWYLLGRCYMSQQKYPKAYEAYQQAVYRDGRNPTFWCSIGVLYYQINQYRDALDAYSRAIRLNPNISEVWYDLGTLVSRSEFGVMGSSTDNFTVRVVQQPDKRCPRRVPARCRFGPDQCSHQGTPGAAQGSADQRSAKPGRRATTTRCTSSSLPTRCAWWRSSRPTMGSQLAEPASARSGTTTARCRQQLGWKQTRRSAKPSNAATADESLRSA